MFWIPMKLDIVAVAAHPDDAEIIMGGTIAKTAHQGYKVGIIDLTDGEPTPYNDDPQIRLEEAQEAAEILGCAVRETLALPNRQLFDNFEARIELAKALRKYQPDTVITVLGKTPMTSPDHYQSQLITEAGIFYARLSKWEQYFGDLKTWRARKLLYAPTARGFLNDLLQRGNHFAVNISEFIETKNKAIRAYKSQFRANPFRKAEITEYFENYTRFWGSLAGCQHAELFIQPEMLLIDDIVQMDRNPTP
ncbi:MAG: PIG-L family deacetylase [Candidatus Hodarchaeales archaeon]